MSLVACLWAVNVWLLYTTFVDLDVAIMEAFELGSYTIGCMPFKPFWLG